MTKILVLTTEPLPLPDRATTGAGLRAWGLAEGLRSRGHNVTIAMPLHGDESEDRIKLPPAYSHVRFFRRDAIGQLLHAEQPDVVVLQHWGMASEIPELSVPLAIDLAGPHLLERLYWGSQDPTSDLQEKLNALQRADFLICSGYYQRHYFYPYLAMAGFDLTSTSFPVIPFSVPPSKEVPQIQRRANTEVTFVYGGAFLAWQDPANSIRWLLDEMDKANTGRLLFYGGQHPVLDASAGKFAELLTLLNQHPRVEMRGWRPLNQLMQEYLNEGDVALDLMERNPERELAFTTRTMIYLRCGLPVLYNNYSEISSIIRDNNCGWALPPDNEILFRNTVAAILKGNAGLAEMHSNAIKAAEMYTWDQTIDPLAEFCAHPTFRAGKTQKLLARKSAEKELDSLRAQLEQARTSAPRRSLFSFLPQQGPFSPGKLAAPVIYLLAWPVALYLRIKLKRS